MKLPVKSFRTCWLLIFKQKHLKSSIKSVSRFFAGSSEGLNSSRGESWQEEGSGPRRRGIEETGGIRLHQTDDPISSKWHSFNLPLRSVCLIWSLYWPSALILLLNIPLLSSSFSIMLLFTWLTDVLLMPCLYFCMFPFLHVYVTYISLFSNIGEKYIHIFIFSILWLLWGPLFALRLCHEFWFPNIFLKFLPASEDA